MSSIKRSQLSRGFSLIELLIVLLIVSIVYFIGFSGIEIGKKKLKALTPLSLKSTITSSKSFSKNTTLLCTNQCQSCYLRESFSSDFKPYIGPLNLKNIKAYTIDKHELLSPIEYGRYKDEKICLIMHFYNNGSSTQVILENDKESYFLPAFFGKPQTFSSLEEAKEYWLRQSGALSDTGDFY